MKCVICDGEIEKKYTTNANGERVMYWDSGENAEPVAEGRCCETCNWTVVIPARLRA